MTKPVVLILLVARACSGQEQKIDAANSSITIHVGKTGLFSAAGHEHWVKAPIASGTLDEGGTPHVELSVDAKKLNVQPDAKVSAKDLAAIQNEMQHKVLDSDKYAMIEFRSTSVQKTAEGAWKVNGALTLRGVTKPVTVDVKRESDAYTGKTTIKQTDFGIQPVSAVGGAVKVKNELDIQFQVRADRRL